VASQVGMGKTSLQVEVWVASLVGMGKTSLPEVASAIRASKEAAEEAMGTRVHLILTTKSTNSLPRKGCRRSMITRSTRRWTSMFEIQSFEVL